MARDHGWLFQASSTGGVCFMEIQARKKSRVMDELVAMGLKGLSCYNEMPRFSISLSILQKGQVLVKEGDRFNGVYIVRSGFLKNVYFDVISSEDKVLGFFFSGDFVGLDSVVKKQYRSTVIALETVGVIKLSFSGLEDFPGDVYDRLEFLCFRIRESSAKMIVFEIF